MTYVVITPSAEMAKDYSPFAIMRSWLFPKKSLMETVIDWKDEDIAAKEALVVLFSSCFLKEDLARI